MRLSCWVHIRSLCFIHSFYSLCMGVWSDVGALLSALQKSAADQCQQTVYPYMKGVGPWRLYLKKRHPERRSSSMPWVGLFCSLSEFIDTLRGRECRHGINSY